MSEEKAHPYFFPAGKKIHFVGVAGSGISSLAQLAAWRGARCSGSDRFFDRGESGALRRILEEEGIEIFPQDGSGIGDADLVVSSAAVEADIPDLREAERRGIEFLSRWQFLLRLGEGKRKVAIAGTNGKSTTTALIGWIMEQSGMDPSLIMGAAVKNREEGAGNARRGESDWLVFEADESDGGLGHYRPEIGVITNVSPDHFSFEEVKKIFSEFAPTCRRLVLNADCPVSATIAAACPGSRSFSLVKDADIRAASVECRAAYSRFTVRGDEVFLPLPGIHNIYNALAAVAGAELAGVDPTAAVAALSDFPGLKRRLETISSEAGITVFDDYSHNPAKVAAALQAVRRCGKRIFAVYQPHGFAPLRRFLNPLADSFSRNLGSGDRLFLLPVYYAGGTVAASIGSEDLKKAISGPFPVDCLPDHRVCQKKIIETVEEGDVVLVMGARDPSLSDLARRIAGALENGCAPPGRGII